MNDDIDVLEMKFTHEWNAGYRAGYRAGKEVGLSESGQAGEIAQLRVLLERAKQEHDGPDHCQGCQAADQAKEVDRDQE